MSRFSQVHPAGGFRLDSPVKVPVASEMLRCAPPHTFGAGEEPCQGGARVETQSGPPENDGSNCHGGLEVSGEFDLSGRDAAPVLEAAECTFDQVFADVCVSVVVEPRDSRPACCQGWR